ncbi:MAG: hypothetical protein ACLGIN_07630 [Candidatus Sericytochromatia bacterium]
MWHHFAVLFYMLCWMTGPLFIFGFSPRKNRDPYLWVFTSAIFGPPVVLLFFALPARPRTV